MRVCGGGGGGVPFVVITPRRDYTPSLSVCRVFRFAGRVHGIPPLSEDLRGGYF